MLKLRELRKKAGMTMKELGLEIGVAESTISQYETSKRQPDYETLLKLGEFFGVSVDYLLTGAEQKEKAPTLIARGRGRKIMENQIVSKEVFGKRFSELLEASTETTYTIGEKLSLSPATISRYAKGLIAPKMPTIFMLAKLFGISPFWLMGYDTPKYDNQYEFDSYEEKSAPVFGRGKNIIQIAGRDGSFVEKHLTDEQLAAMKALIDTLPDAPDEL